MSIRNHRVAAVAAGAALLVGLGSFGAVAGDLVRSKDIVDGTIRLADLNDRTENQLTGQPGERGLQGEPGDPASDRLGELAASAPIGASPTVIEDLGGSILDAGESQGHTPVTSITLEAGTYLVSAYGHFDRVNDNHVDYLEPTTDTYGALALWVGDSWTGFDQARGTYITGAISPKGFVEATASGSQLVTVTETTELNVSAFGYNEDRSPFGSTTAGAPQFSVLANVSAVKVG